MRPWLGDVSRMVGLSLLLGGCELLAGIDDRFVSPAAEVGSGGAASAATTGMASSTGAAGGAGGADPTCPGLGGGPPQCTNCAFPCTTGVRCPQPTKLAAGSGHSCLLLDDGALWCWGSEQKGQLGRGVAVDPSAPVRIECLPAVHDVTAGSTHTCALDAEGSVWCWGDNEFGQCGVWDDGANVDVVERPAKVALPEGVVALDAHGEATCASTASGQVWCWGIRLDGQGWNPELDWKIHAAPQQKTLSGPAEGVGVSSYRACASVSTAAGLHDLFCWGDGAAGQLGNDAMNDSAGPVNALWPPALAPQSIRGGGDHVCALGAGGELFCWGDCTNWQCGLPPEDLGECPDPAIVGCQDTPLDVTAALDTAAEIVGLDAGWRHTCALDAATNLHCWGQNASYEVGVSGLGSPPVAVQSDVVAFATGWKHTCVVSAAEVSCWGSNELGQVDPGGPPQLILTPNVIDFPR